MVDHYVQQHHLSVQREQNDARIRTFITGSSQQQLNPDLGTSDNYPEIDGVYPFDYNHEMDLESVVSCSPSLSTYTRMSSECFSVYNATNNITFANSHNRYSVR